MKAKKRRKNLCRNCAGKMRFYHLYCPFCGHAAGKLRMIGLGAGLLLFVATLYVAVYFAN